MKPLKEKIKLLKAHGITQMQIAAHCQCGQPAISDIVRGKVKDPRGSILIGITELYDTVLNQIVVKSKES